MAEEIKSPSSWVELGLCAFGFALLAFFGAVALASGAAWVAVGVLWVGAVVFVWFSIRAKRARIIRTPSGLEARRTFGRRVSLSWEAIAWVRYRGWDGGLAAYTFQGEWIKLQDYGVLAQSARLAERTIEGWRPETSGEPQPN